MDGSFQEISFEDADEFAEWEASLGWDMESTQISYGPNLIGFDYIEFPALSVTHFHVAQTQVDFFELPAGMVFFLICRAKLPAVWNGRVVPPSHMAVIRSGENHTSKLQAGWDCYEFLVEEELVRRTELFPLEFFERTIQIENALLPLPDPLTETFLTRLNYYFDRSRRTLRKGGDPDIGSEVYDFLIHGLREVIDGGLGVVGPSPVRTRGAALIPNARDIIEANLKADLTADDIAQKVGVSYRTLHYAFQETLGVSPYRYYLTRRLQAVRQLLKSGEMSVSEASFAHRFYTPSRFSRQYKRLFGELPSETARRSSA